ncbi:hypothetical protein PO909_024723 [Leuciscus waleckii]
MSSTLHHCSLPDKPILTVKPQSSVFTGDTVTLSCDVGSSTGWTFHWRKDSNREYNDDEGTKTIRSVKVSDGGTYECRAQRGEYYTHLSNAIQITVREERESLSHVSYRRQESGGTAGIKINMTAEEQTRSITAQDKTRSI